MKNYIYAISICLIAILLQGCIDNPVENHTPKIIDVYSEDITYQGATLCAHVDNYTYSGEFIVSLHSDMSDTLRIYDEVWNEDNIVGTVVDDLPSGVTYYFQFVAFDIFKSSIDSFSTLPRAKQEFAWLQKNKTVHVGDTIIIGYETTSPLDIQMSVSTSISGALEYLESYGRGKAICLCAGKIAIYANQSGNADYLPLSSKLEIEVENFPDIEREPVDLGLSRKWSNISAGVKNINSRAKQLYNPYYVHGYMQYVGEGWRCPTQKEISEFISKCKVSEVRKFREDREIYKMFKITGPNGNSVWMSQGKYWSSERPSQNSHSFYILEVREDGKLISSSLYDTSWAGLQLVEE